MTMAPESRAIRAVRGLYRGARPGLLTAVLSLLAGWSWIDHPVVEVEQGNREFARGRYAEALAHYDRALEQGHEPGLELDRGLALYRLALAADGEERERLVARAEDALSQALSSQQGAERATALVALGNLDLAQGAVGNAIQAYRRALREDSDNPLARHNLELALRRRAEARRKADDSATGAQGPGEQGSAEASADGKGPVDEANGAGSQADREGEGTAREPATDPQSDAAQAAPDAADGSQAANGRPETLDDVDLQDLSRKLDALERRSRALRRSLFSGSGGRPTGGSDF